MKFHNHFILQSYTVLIAKHTAEMLKSKINLGIMHCASIALCLYGHMHATSIHRKHEQERGPKSDLLQLTIRKKLHKGTRKRTTVSETYRTPVGTGVVLKLLPCYWPGGQTINIYNWHFQVSAEHFHSFLNTYWTYAYICPAKSIIQHQLAVFFWKAALRSQRKGDS